MAWSRKSTAPASVNLTQAFIALVTGDPIWGWLVDWMPLIPDALIDVTALCAAGPPPAVAALSPLDFFGPTRPTPLSYVANKAGLIYKITSVVQDRLFGAYCENVVPAGGTYSLFFSGAPAGNTFLGPSTGWLIPAGATKVRITRLTNDTGGFSDLHHVGYAGGVNTCNPTGAAMMPAIGTSSLSDLSVCPTIDHAAWRTAGTGGTFSLEWFFPGGASLAYTPTSQPAPAGVIAPAVNAYASIADLGRELDRQEFKLEQITALVTFLASYAGVGPVSSAPPVDAAAGVLIDAAAIGYSIAVSNIPADADELFGVPPKYHRLGRATIGSANGWLPSIDLEHTPMLIAPLPPGVDRIQVVVNPPATATITPLYAPK